MKFEFIWDMGLEKVRKYLDTEETEIVFVERPRSF